MASSSGTPLYLGALSQQSVQPPAPPADPNAVVPIPAQAENGPRVFEFPASVVARYPKLLDAGTRFLRLDVAYDFLVTNDVTQISNSLLQDADDRQRFLYVCSRLDRQLSREEVHYISRVTGVESSLKNVRKSIKGFKQTFLKFIGSQATQDWAMSHDHQIRRLHASAMSSGVNSTVILHEIAKKGYAQLAQWDYEHGGLVSGFAQSFLAKFAASSFRGN